MITVFFHRSGAASRTLLYLGTFMLAFVPLPAFAQPLESLPQGMEPAAIEIEPARIELKKPLDYVQLLVFARMSGGERIDVTRMATIESTSPLVAVSPSGLLRARSDGSAEIVATLGGLSARAELDCQGTTEPLDVDFVHDVMPVLAKLGCNSGTCHGSKDGKNGFKLSLRGYDPLLDSRSLADDLGARRINRASPDNSLMLLKATGSVPHGGNQVTQVGSPEYEILRAWIAGGATLDLTTPRVARIELFPRDPIVPAEGMTQQFRVLATYADGQTRDVTAEAFLSSGNTDVAAADDRGLLTALRRGESPVLARFEGAYTATTLTVMGDRDGFIWRDPPANNAIDRFVQAKLKRTRTSPSPVCRDEEFIRRVFIDLTGLPPTVEQVKAFLADTRESWLKRSELIDQLVGSSAYVDYWTNKWSDLLQVNRKFLGDEGAAAFHTWIRKKIEDNTPYDRFVYEILSASGSNRENPAASYYKVLREPAAIMENTTHLFLATRFNCNKCHDHPFERWTQDQYYEMAAFFARVGLKTDEQSQGKTVGGTAVEGAKPLYEIVHDLAEGEMRHDRTGAVTPPKFPYDHPYSCPDDATRRERLARWVTAPENAYFARSYVNRVWGYLLGRGLIEPIDDIRAGNPPSNPELLDWLTRSFVDKGFDSRELMRTICKSRTYQHSVAADSWNEDDAINHSHAIARRLPAEVLFDAVHHVTGSRPRSAGLPEGVRAVQLPDAAAAFQTEFLDQFGKPARESACECERSNTVELGPVMALVNGPTIAEAIADPENAIARLVGTVNDDRQVIEELFLRVLNRRATADEVAAGLEAMAAASEDHQRLVAAHQQAAAALEAYRQTLPDKIASWEKEQLPTEWFPLDLVEFANSMGSALTKEADGSWYLSGKNGKGQYTFKAHLATQDVPGLRGITGFRLETLADSRLPKNGPGRGGDGNFVLTEFSVEAAPKSDPQRVAAIKFKTARATHSQADRGVEQAIDGNRDSGGWSIGPQAGRNHSAVFETEAPFVCEGDTVLSFALDQVFHDGQHSIGRLRLWATTSPQPLKVEDPPAELLAILHTASEQRSDEQRGELAKFYRRDDAELRRLETAEDTSRRRVADRRLLGAQDIAWALINSQAFLFNR